MLLHRLMTLGHIVASTKLGLFGARKHLNPEEFLNRHGVEVPITTLSFSPVQVMKEIQDTVEPPEEGVTMEVKKKIEEEI